VTRALAAAVAFMGGEVRAMGGNCTAIAFEHGDSQTVIVSTEHDYSAPESLDERASSVTEFISRDGYGETAPLSGTTRELLADLYGQCEGEAIPAAVACLFQTAR
jgi:hypothetical protein